MACDVSWKSRLSKLYDENVLLKTQVASVVQEQENIKLEYQKLFNSTKATRGQHQQEVNELVESISQKTYVYGDVHSKNQDLLMIIYEIKEKLKTFEKGKNVNTKFGKFVTLGTLLCVTPLPTNIAVQAKKVSKSEDNTHRSKPVTSHPIPKSKQKKRMQMLLHTTWSSNSVTRPKSKDTKSKNRVLKNTNAKSSSGYVRKTPSSVRIDSNKRETINLNECQSNASVLNTKTVNAVNDDLNLICVSCGKDMFLLSHEKCVALYALYKDSRVKIALFTTPKAAKSRSLGVSSVGAKSRFSIAETPTTTNKIRSRLRNCVRKFIGTVRFGNDHFGAIMGYKDYVIGDSVISRVYYVEGLRHNLFSVGQFCDSNLKVAFRKHSCYVRDTDGVKLIKGSRGSDLYTISV
nr:integrase, catalytic region, zinc finger, CCHC-type, peptidase aspartic, catalytic [Tanacetum cinerariifolium]